MPNSPRKSEVWRLYFRRAARIAAALAVIGAVYEPGLMAQAPAATSGRIEGVATISRQLVKTHRRLRIYSEPGQRSQAQVVDDQPIINVVLYLAPAPALHARTPLRSPAASVMTQRGERFVPYVLPVLAGSAVTFPNEDPFYHNVFSLSSAREFDLGRFPRGQSRQVSFPKAGIVQVFCHIHADMSAYILVLEHPFFVVPDAKGRFALENVPAGDYQLIAWHERIRPLVTPIRVEAGATTALDLRIPLPAMAAR